MKKYPVKKGWRNLIIRQAKEVQIKGQTDVIEVRKITKRLLAHLDLDDKFWPRWVYFAEKNGVRV
mgnify:CR=1 FL=1